jgi:hypothetical protein
MSRRFIVVIEKPTPEQENLITANLQGRGWGFWHWLSGVWLLAGVPQGQTPRQLYEELAALQTLDMATLIVLDVSAQPLTYWGRGIEAGWKWMAESWGVPG